jgi:hypothetical protein
MIDTTLIIGVVMLLAWLFLGLPYYQAYRRRKELMRREQVERENEKSNCKATPKPEPPEK